MLNVEWPKFLAMYVELLIDSIDAIVLPSPGVIRKDVERVFLSRSIHGTLQGSLSGDLNSFLESPGL